MCYEWMPYVTMHIVVAGEGLVTVLCVKDTYES